MRISREAEECRAPKETPVCISRALLLRFPDPWLSSCLYTPLHCGTYRHAVQLTSGVSQQLCAAGNKPFPAP